VVNINEETFVNRNLFNNKRILNEQLSNNIVQKKKSAGLKKNHHRSFHQVFQ
jgi:hypothetical protein